MSTHDSQEPAEAGHLEDVRVSTTPAQAQEDSGGGRRRPSYSPITPTLSQASLTSHDGEATETATELPAVQWMDDPPEALPVSIDENPDAIALRATLSVLQIQRQQALRDMRTLDKMKTAASESPEQFVQDLTAGKLVKPSNETSYAAESTSSFGKFPAAQDIVRTPPIEWSKYHIVGQPLDRMHEMQQQYPGSTEEMQHSSRLQPHTIAAPYRPFVDKLDEPKSIASSKPKPG